MDRLLRISQRVSIILVYLTLFLTGANSIFAQECRIDRLNGERISIGSTDTISLRFLITDAIADQIGQDGQGVCRVSLEFFHRDVTDLNMTLYSPDGKNVILVGPAVEGSSGLQLFGLLHDISFVPSTLPADPDGGLSDRWDNEDPDWGNNSAYAGTYYPFSGDLDVNFNNSPVNGVWELVIIDQFPTVQNEGQFGSFRMEFCDQTLECNICEAQSGSFLQDSITICEGQGFSYFDIYTPAKEDNTDYEEIFLSFSGNLLLARNEVPDFEGSYMIYALTILKEQKEAFNEALDGMNRLDILNMVKARGGKFCVDISDPAILTITQSSGLKIVLPTDSLSINCSETSVLLDASNSSINNLTTFQWKDPSQLVISNNPTAVVETVGRYTIILDDGLCQDSMNIIVSKEIDELNVDIASSVDTLQCKNTWSQLSFMTTMKVNEISWQNLAGQELSQNDSLTISQAGTFILKLTGDGECGIMDSITVLSDFSKPKAQVITDTITCSSFDANVTLATDDLLTSYKWSNSSNDLQSTEDQFTTNFPGIYTLEITGQNGCDTTISFEVAIDTMLPIVEGIPEISTLNCEINEISINPAITAANGYQVLWEKNGQSFSSQSGIIITDSGSFSLIVEGSNGCNAVNNTLVELDREEYMPRLDDAILSCKVESVSLQTDTDTFLFDIRWSGGVLDGVTIPDPVIQTPGTYIYQIQNKMNKCIGVDTVIVRSDRDDPVYSITGDSLITCKDSIGVVDITTDDASLIKWFLSNQDTLLSNELTFDDPGEYTFYIESDNGCAVSGSWVVMSDEVLPVINLNSNYVLTCEEPELNLSITDQNVVEVIWKFQNDPNIASDNYNLSIPGFLDVTVEGSNGCQETKAIEIIENKGTPEVQIVNNDTLTCTPLQILLRSSIENAKDQVNYIWTLSDQIVGNGPELLTSGTGLFTLIAIYGGNGCSTEDSVSIFLTEDPILGLELDIASETCDQEQNGRIELIDLIGGKGPFQYFINNVEQNAVSEDNLNPGTYEIKIVDANQCTVDTSVVIDQGIQLSVNLGPDIQVKVDEMVDITTIIDGPINDFGWFVNGDSYSLGTLDGISITPNEDVLVIMKVFSEEGCTAQDSIYIDVVYTLDDVSIYIPNVFMPTSTSANRALNVSLHESILSIDKFIVYDRWGNMVHQVISPVGRFNINLWDGFYNGRMVDPGVFTYLCEVTTVVDGQKKLFTGNITVLN